MSDEERKIEWIDLPPRPKATPERLAELEAMLQEDPEIRRMTELCRLREKRVLTPEEEAELDAIFKPIRDRDPFLIDDSI